MDKTQQTRYKFAVIFAFAFVVLAFLISTPSEIYRGMVKIMLADDLLITDYFELAGFGAALTNVGIVTITTVFLMYKCEIPLNGGGILTLGLMSGFSFFGKNFFNMWFILLGTWIYCKVSKELFRKCIIISLLSTALAPIISITFFYNGIVCVENAIISLLCGIIIGFIMPMLALHTDRLLHGLSLYNGGFAIGLLGLIIVPILKSYGFEFYPTLAWKTEYNTEVGVSIFAFCFILIASGIIVDRKNAVKNYFNILKRPGLPSHDFTTLDGMGAVLINMGVNGIIATCYILLINGDLNGPTIGGILTIIGFGAKGKHAKNIIPVMIGVYLGGLTKLWSPNAPSAQLAALFGTTLAPVAGTYGFLAGILAGFIHSSVVLHAGLGYSGVNLYNNGFAGGIVSIVLYPVLTKFLKQNRYSEPSYSMTVDEQKEHALIPAIVPITEAVSLNKKSIEKEIVA